MILEKLLPIDTLIALNRMCSPNSSFKVRKEFIWFNPYVKINKSTIFFKLWYNKGIRFINDIINSDTEEFPSHTSLNEKYQEKKL